MLSDKSVIQQVLGGLMHRPQFLSEVDKYKLTIMDFSSKFEKYIFSAILGLYEQGASDISPIDIENYLSTNDAAKATFENQNGIEYLQDIIELSSEDNFNYYYSKLKKLNLLKDLKKQGFDITDYYCEDLTDKRATEINARFEELTTQDICALVKKKLLKLENEYAQSEEVQEESAADNFLDFINELNDDIEVGPAVQGAIYNEIIGGARRSVLTIRSGASGLGKTRQAVADACYLAYPIRYDSYKSQWVMTGGNEKVLFIITEQTFKQIRKMILAYLTDMDDSRFKYGHFSEEEMTLLLEAKRVVDQYASNFIIVKMPNPTIESIKLMVRENCLTKDISCVFFDYIFIGPAVLREFQGFSLRNDEVLLMMATALKDLAVELNVAMFTSTQVNASADSTTTIRNEASLAGGRSTINKADNGAIMARPSKEELELLEEAGLLSKYGVPNCVTDIFKVREGRWSQVRIWSIVDLGRMKKKDLFVTNANLEAIEDFFAGAAYDIQNWEDDKYIECKEFLKDLNGND
jgi:Replicative DNA helicase